MSKAREDIIPSIGLILLSAWVFYETSTYPPEASLLPRLMAYIILFLSATLIIKAISKVFSTGEAKQGEQSASSGQWVKIIPAVCLWVISIAVIPVIGFFLTLGLFWLILVLYLEGKGFQPGNLLKCAGYGLVITVLLYLIFRVGVQVPTPTGLFV